MPGLFGIISRQPSESIRGDLDRMIGDRSPHFESESLVDPLGRWAVGRTHLGVLNPSPQLHHDSPLQALVHGDVFAARVQGIASDANDVVAAAYRQHGLDGGRHVDGSYCSAILDADQRRLVLLVDAVASYPLYWSATGTGLAFASELRAVLRHPAVRRTLDPRALADYVKFGFPLGVKTLASGVQLVPPGSAVVYDMERGTTSIHRFATMVDAFDPWAGSESSFMEAVAEAFRAAVHHAASGGHSVGLSLSGGLDSRAILSGLNGHSHELATYTLGVKGCADQVIARRLACIAGTRHTFFELDERYLKDFLPNLQSMITVTDGMYLSHGLTEILALNFLRNAGFSVLLRGHGGELAKMRLAWPLHTDDQVDTLRGTGELVPYLFRRFDYISSTDLADVFTDSWRRRTAGAAQASLDESVAGVPLGASDLCSYLYLTEHHRRSTTASLELFRQAVEVRMPFADARFLSTLFRGRPEWRADTRIHRALTKSGNRALLRVRNSNTGAAGDASATTELVLDKFNSLFKRLNLPGYRHYHNFQGWMREQLLASVSTVLLSPTSLDRGVLDRRGVQRLLDETRAGGADHSYLLQVLLILELWQRENF